MTLKITLDTNILPSDDIIKIANDHSLEFAVVSVTEREVGEKWKCELRNFGVIPETGIYGESIFGECVTFPPV